MNPIARLTALLDKLDGITVRCGICSGLAVTAYADDRPISPAVTMIGGTPLCGEHAEQAAWQWVDQS